MFSFLHVGDAVMRRPQPKKATTAGCRLQGKLLGICFRARLTGNGQNRDGRRGVRGVMLQLPGNRDLPLWEK